ncbi:hypothetical protein WJN01_14905 [Flavobacteriaceae bacterium SZ-1-7]|uniref:hypothetical protein n=1 Tax=Tamlana sedimenti TaxID=3134126 RepID=UPI00312AFB90
MKRAYLRGLIFVLIFAVNFSLLNCEGALNCLTGLKPPELPTKQLMPGYFEKNYYDTLVPYVPQNPDAQGYNWYFELEGQLPEGIEVYLDAEKIVFEGIPKQTGIFELKIFLDVDPINGVGLCDSARTSREYTLQINP